MRSSVPKVLHPLAGVPIIEHVLRAAESLSPRQVVAVLDPGVPDAVDLLAGRATVAWQPEPLGTADAVRVAMPLIDPSVEWVVVLYGADPLVTPSLLGELVGRCRTEKPLIGMLTFQLHDPGPYGRVWEADGRVTAVVEAADDTRVYDGPVRLNSGIGCYDRAWLDRQLPDVPASPKGEYYLTSLFSAAAGEPHPRSPIIAVDGPAELLIGINDRIELAAAEQVLRSRKNEDLMRAGVTVVDPATTYIDIDVEIGIDTRIEPGCLIKGHTRIGAACRIGPQSVIDDSLLGDRVTVRSSWIEQSEIGADSDVGPYSHLRPGTLVASGVHIGNYVETKNASVGRGSSVGHVSYLGDARLGERVNIGAGTITCNFDGHQKHRTEIGDDAFIGSDTMLVAPLKVGRGARTGAGAVVNRDIPDGRTAVGVPARILGLERRAAGRIDTEE
jgi:bifunctional UDP-N-acetylglucosamine pyrophosphorylase/glucosamine-1-phosphate N-acetyltransferase